MKTGIVGNSHLAALRVALGDHTPGTTGIEHTFFGAPGGNFGQVGYANGKICGPSEVEEYFLITSGNKFRELSVTDFDAVVFYGGFRAHTLVEQIYKQIRDSKTAYSEDFLRAGIDKWLNSLKNFNLARKVAEHESCHVLLMPCPTPSQFARWEQPGQMTQPFRLMIWNHIQAIARDYGLHALFQPESTMSPNQLTLPEFSMNSCRLRSDDSRHADEDVAHMNETYGALVIKSIEEKLSHLG